MEITVRGLCTLIHGMGFGALYLLACSGALIELYRLTVRPEPSASMSGAPRFLKAYLLTMVALAWATVLIGTYLVYPWYRAAAPAGTMDLSTFPQRLLLSNAKTAGWHSLGMEWKEHIAWLVPISISMVAFVFLRYARDLKNHRSLRAAVLGFAASSFVAAGIAGFFGAMIDKHAPVEGGATIRLNQERPH
jgi:hypothetical protein